jgi:hypothetical protein
MVKSLKFIAFMAQYARHESNVHGQASHGGCKPRSVVALHAAADPSSGYSDLSEQRLVVGGLHERRGLRFRMSHAISQLAGYCLLGAGWRDHAPRGQRVTEKTHPCALQVCPPTWESLGGKRYNGQSSVSQFADRGRVQDVRAKQTVGIGAHDLLAARPCLIKIQRLGKPSNGFTQNDFLRRTAKVTSPKQKSKNKKQEKNGMRLSPNTFARIAAFLIQCCLTFTTSLRQARNALDACCKTTQLSKQSKKQKQSALRYAAIAIG